MLIKNLKTLLLRIKCQHDYAKVYYTVNEKSKKRKIYYLCRKCGKIKTVTS